MSTVAFTFDPAQTGQPLTNAPYTLGCRFVANVDMSVTHLGVFDDSHDGLQAATQAGIWDSLGNLLGSVTVAAGTTDPLTNEFRYHALSSPVTLAASTTYVIGALYPDNGTGSADVPLVFPGNTDFGWAPAAEVTFSTSTYEPGATLSFNNLSNNTSAGYWGVNFLFVPAFSPGTGSISLDSDAPTVINTTPVASTGRHPTIAYGQDGAFDVCVLSVYAGPDGGPGTITSRIRAAGDTSFAGSITLIDENGANLSVADDTFQIEQAKDDQARWLLHVLIFGEGATSHWQSYDECQSFKRIT